MAKESPTHLRIFGPAPHELVHPSADLDHLENVCLAFEDATGWKLEFAAGLAPPPGTRAVWSAPLAPALGHFRLLDAPRGAGAATRIRLDMARTLAESLGALWQELTATRLALWEREAELAAGVPVCAGEEEPLKLAVRLESILRAGAEAVGFHAAGLFLLDAATTELKLRQAGGFPRAGSSSARPLRGAIADLEALLGHAVVLTDEKLFDYWKVPEPYAAAACVPVATSSTQLGTLWVFGREKADLSEAQVNLLEVVAGRLAVELERTMLLEAQVAARRHANQNDAAQERAANLVPSFAPSLPGWSIAARSRQSLAAGGAMHDWFSPQPNELSIVAGVARDRSLCGALTAAAIRGATRSMAKYNPSPSELLSAAGEVLWSGSSGDQTASMLAARLGTSSGDVALAAAGNLALFLIDGEDVKPIVHSCEPLGTGEELPLARLDIALAHRQTILAFGASEALSGELALSAARAAAHSGESAARLSADAMVRAATDVLLAGPAAAQDIVVLAIARDAQGTAGRTPLA